MILEERPSVLFPQVMRGMACHVTCNVDADARVPFEEFVVAEVLTGTDDSASSIVTASARRIGKCGKA